MIPTSGTIYRFIGQQSIDLNEKYWFIQTKKELESNRKNIVYHHSRHAHRIVAVIAFTLTEHCEFSNNEEINLKKFYLFFSN